MTNTYTTIGKLQIVEKLKRSLNGNPRWLVLIDGTPCKTIPNTDEAYGIKRFDGKMVLAEIGMLYRKLHCRNIRLA